MTYQIIYSSESATPMQTEDLEEILEHARSSNATNGITGALVYVDGVFLQILEGEIDSLQKLMARIAKDVRHETVTVLKEGEVSSATFTDWTDGLPQRDTGAGCPMGRPETDHGNP